MNTYIVRYAPLDGYGNVIQDIKTAKILSDSKNIDYIKSEFKKRCDLANEHLMNYEGMLVGVKTLEYYLDNLPSDVI